MFKSKARREAEQQLKIQQEKENILAEQQRRQERGAQQQERAQALLSSIGLWYSNLSTRNKAIVAVGGLALMFGLGQYGTTTPETATTTVDEPAPTSLEVAAVPVAEEPSPAAPAPIAASIIKTGEDFQYTAPGSISFKSGEIVVSYHHTKSCENTGRTFEQEWETTFNLASRTWTDRARQFSNCLAEGDREWTPYSSDAQPFEISESEGQTTIHADLAEPDGTIVGDNFLVVTYRQGIAQTPIDALETVTETAAQSLESSESPAAAANNEQPASKMAEPAPGQIGRLTASTANARINLRDEPSANTPTNRYGLEGDRVVLQDTTSGSDGYTWHKVQFQGSGAIGWVRADFVEF